MSHEPECFGTQNIHYSSSDCPICTLIRAAYQRGRQDAANAVLAKVLEHNTAITGRIWETSLDQDDYIAAARGVSSSDEQADTGNGGEQS